MWFWYVSVVHGTVCDLSTCLHKWYAYVSTSHGQGVCGHLHIVVICHGGRNSWALSTAVCFYFNTLAFVITYLHVHMAKTSQKTAYNTRQFCFLQRIHAHRRYHVRGALIAQRLSPGDIGLVQKYAEVQVTSFAANLESSVQAAAVRTVQLDVSCVCRSL